MKETIFVWLRELASLAKAAAKCEWAVVTNNEPAIGDLCGDCIYCWIMRKIAVFVMITIIGSIDPLLGIIALGSYLYFARRDFAKKMDM